MSPILLSYRTLGLGDLLTAVPALRGLRAAYPRHRHVVAAPRWLAPMVDLIEAVDEHLAVDELRPVPWPPGQVDVAVNLHGRGPQSHRVLEAVGPRTMIAYHHPAVPSSDDGPRWVESQHEVDRWCRLLEAHDIDCDPSDLGLSPPDVDLPPYVPRATVIHPGAKAAARRWPADRFAEVARWEADRGRNVVITGSADEEPLARAIAWAAGLRDDRVLAGTTDLPTLAAVVGAAGRVVCGDTGVGHLATALDTPSVVLFGPTPPDEWGPPEDRRDRHRVLWKGRRGAPLADRPDAGLLDISVGEVVAELGCLPDACPRSA